MRQVALAVVLLCPTAALAADEQPGFDFAARWGAWGEVGGTYGTGQSSYGEIGIFAPLWQSPDSLVFTDIRGKVYESAIVEGNFALGARRMLPSGWNLGGWGALDVRRTASDNVFGQISGGLEALSEHFDARLNGYLPFTGPQTAGPGMADVILDGGNIFMVGGREVALRGVDAEIGGRLPLAAGNRATLGVYGGGFWFGHEDAAEAIAGGKARVELAFNDVLGAGSRFSAQYEFVSDTVRGGRHLFGARLRIPLGGTPPSASAVSGQWLRMADRIERDVDIVIGQSSAEAVEDALTDVNFDQVAYVEGGGSITDTSTDFGDSTLILVTGTVSGSQELHGNQTLQGGGSTIQVRGLNSGAVSNFTAPGATAHLINPGDATNLTLLGSNTHVAGLRIQGEGQGSGVGEHGIFGGSDKNNIVIEQTSINDVNIDGIHLDDNNRNVTISGTAITKAGNSGIYFEDGNRNVTIANTAFTDTGGDSISFIDGNQNVTISGVDIDNAGFHGIFFNNENSNVTIAGATVTGAFVDGIQFNNFNTDVTITDTTITGVGNNGITFVNGNSNVTIEDTTITGTGLDGIHFDTNNSNVLIADTTVTDVRFGIQFNTENSNVAVARTRIRSVFTGIGVGTENDDVTIADTLITDTDNNGIVFGSLNSTVTISGVTVTDAGSNGITFFNENRNVTISGTTVASPDGSGIFFNHDNDNVDISGATVTGAGGSGIVFGDEHDGVTIAHATITDAGETGIFFRDDNSNVAISGTTITNVGSDGISFGTGNNGTIADTSITNASDDGIEMGGGNTIDIVRTRIADVDFGIFFFGTGNNVTIADATITDATFRGLLVAGDEHTIAMDRTVFAGNFDKVIEIYFTSNALSGANNSAANAYIQFCDASPQLNGTFFAFDDDGTGNPATCPR